MLKIFLNLILVVVAIYWAGDVARQNSRIDAFVAQLELGYGQFNQRLRDTTIIDGLTTLQRLYGWAAILTVASLFLFGRLFGGNGTVGIVWSSCFLISVFGWFSIRWCISHRRAATEYGSQVALLVFGPTLMGILDVLAGTPFTQLLAEPFGRIPNPWGWENPVSTANPMALGAAMSLALAVFFAVYYVITWMLAIPAAFASAVLVALPVAVARFIHVIAPRKAFFGLTVVVFTAATLWQLWL
jgi:hypothetical protein